MTIRELAYTLYKIDWMRRISIDRILDFVKDYYDDCSVDDNWSTSLPQAIEECGFDGQIYACFEEFLDAEYQDKDYMKELLNEFQYQEYLADIAK